MAIFGTRSWYRNWLALAALAGAASLVTACGGSSNNGGVGGRDGATDGATGGRAGADGGMDVGGADGPTDHGVDVATDAPPPTTLAFTFDNSLMGFDIDRIAVASPLNLGAVTVDGGTLVTADFDPSVGMPAAGSAHITATFTDHNQLVAFRIPYNTTQTINLAGKTITAQIRLDPGVDAGSTTFSGVARLFALSSPGTPGFYLAEGASLVLSDNTWHTMTFRLSTPEFADPNFVATDVVQLGVHLVTPAPVGADASAPAFGAPQSISVHFDTLTSN